jgi:hypothetical protein
MTGPKKVLLQREIIQVRIIHSPKGRNRDKSIRKNHNILSVLFLMKQFSG